MPSSKKTQAAKLTGIPWRFDELWNQAIDSLPDRPLKARNYIYASELGGDFFSRYLKMNAVVPSNPPNFRAKRKFSAGNIWEWVIGLVLTASGVLKASQLRGEVEIPGMLRVSGRLDFIAGGPVDWDRAKFNIENIQHVFASSLDETPVIISHAIKTVFESFRKQFEHTPLKQYILESKSVGSWMQKKLEGSNQPMEHHVLQISHYLFANKEIDGGKIIYISKDDATTYEFDIDRTKEIKKIYADDVKQMTEYYNNGFDPRRPLKFAPPKPPELYFGEGLWQFRKNFHVEYSPYLTMVHGYKNFEEFKLRWTKPLSSWNRTFRRCVTGANMTALNKETIEDAKKYFPEWDKYVALAKKSGAFQKADENEEE